MFADGKATTAGEVVDTWDDIKRRERAEKGSEEAPDFFAGVSRAAPSLALSQKLQKRAAEVGFDWPDAKGATDKLVEEIDELRDATRSGDPEAVRMELGDVLFSVVNVARKLGLDAETALRAAADKFIARFAQVQLLATQRGIDMTSCGLAQLDELWDEAKRMSR